MDLKQLDKFLKVCRKQGVSDIIFGDLTVKFGDMPKKDSSLVDLDEIATDGLTDEQLMFAHISEGR